MSSETSTRSHMDDGTPITAPVTDWASDYDIFDPQYVADPYGIWDDLRQRCPMAHTDRWGGSWLPTRYADVYAIAHDIENFPSGNTPNLEVLEVTLRRSPDAGYCRLVCPRRLEANTGYYAFVIPTFEVGRRAGLGEKVPDNAPGLDIAWKTATQFPVYYEWFFRTGAAGDFEELVTALKPRPIPKEVGIRDLDIQRPGFGLPAIVSAPDDVVGLEGALLSPFTVPRSRTVYTGTARVGEAAMKLMLMPRSVSQTVLFMKYFAILIPCGVQPFG